MTREEKIRKAIKNHAMDDKKIIIYPFGKLGRTVKEILNHEFGIQESYIFDNNISDDGVQKIESMDVDKMNDYLYLVACLNTRQFTEIIKTLDTKVDDANIVDIFSDEHGHLFLESDWAIFDAQRKGLNLREWLEKKEGMAGRTDVLIDAIVNTVNVHAGGYFCEIGPGTGGYLQKLIEKFRPLRYEFYEVNKALTNYILENNKYEYCTVVAQETDGRSLKETRTASQDVVSAYNVWSILGKYSNIYKYFLEMIRVCKTGGYVIFSTYTEDSYTERVLENDNNVLNEWKVIPNSMIKNTFESRDMKLIRRFEIPYPNKIESLFIFQKTGNEH